MKKKPQAKLIKKKQQQKSKEFAEMVKNHKDDFGSECQKILGWRGRYSNRKEINIYLRLFKKVSSGNFLKNKKGTKKIKDFIYLLYQTKQVNQINEHVVLYVYIYIYIYIYMYIYV